MKRIILIMTIMGLIGCSTTKEAEELFSRSKDVSQQTFYYSQLEGLPEPVQRYFRFALPDGQPYLNQLRLTHTGTFKSGVGKDWMDIKGQQYFTAQPPGFVWIGKTKAFRANDSYVNDKGNLSVYLLGILRIVNSKGPTIDQGELLRWLGESAWMPTNLLPGKHKQWSAIDDNTARLTFTYNKQEVYYIVHFADEGQIVRMETERYMEKDRKEKWEGRLSNYQKVDGIQVPMEIEASWLLEEGKHTYARFQVADFEFNVAEPW